jgi:hypothetical protein
MSDIDVSSLIGLSVGLSLVGLFGYLFVWKWGLPACPMTPAYHPVPEWARGAARQSHTGRREIFIRCEGERVRIDDPDDVLRGALESILDAARAYLPPDGISEQEFINRVLGEIDNPRIAAALEQVSA